MASLLTLLDQGHIVLCASRRLAHALRVSYAHWAQAQGRSAWRTPQALPLSAWLRQQWLDHRALQPTANHMRLLTPSQARTLWERVISESSWSTQIVNVSSTARLVARSWARIHDYRIDLAALAEFDDAESQAFLDWAQEFSTRCEALHVLDEARLPLWAAVAELVPTQPVAFAGFDEFTPAQAALADRWRAANRLIEIDQIGRSQHVEVVAAQDAEYELRLAAQWARQQVEEGKGNIGIIVADLQYRRAEVERFCADVFSPNSRSIDEPDTALPVVIAAPRPLSTYPLVHSALNVLELVCRGGRSTLAGQILRSPFIAGAQAEISLRAMADVDLRDAQLDEWTWFEFERWAARSRCDELYRRAREVSSLIRALPTQDLPSGWADCFNAILRALGWTQDRALDSIEHQTLLKWQSALAELGALDLVVPRTSSARAFAMLSDVVQNTAFEPQSDAAAVTVIDPTTVAGMTFDALWVTGLDATRLPGASDPDAFIPLALQRQAGIPEATAAGVLQRSKRQVDRWIKSAPHVVLSWPRHEGDAELSVSPLLARWSERGFNTTERREAAGSLRELLFAKRPTLEEFEDARAPMLPRESARGGATILELQSQCPFLAQARLRLGAEPLARVVPGVLPLDRGIILHRVLKEVWDSLQSQAELLNRDEIVLEQQIEELVTRHVAHALQPNSRHRNRLATLEIQYVKRQVLTLLNVERRRLPFVVRSAERSEPYVIGGLAITIQLDRVDELASGGQFLIDYKLGASNIPRDWLDVLPGRPRKPQLPLYALAHSSNLAGLAFAILAPGKVEYRGWSNGASVAPGVLPYPGSLRRAVDIPSDWPQLMHYWQTTLQQLAVNYVTGHAEVDPLPQECDRCDLSILCRVHQRGLGMPSEGESDVG